MPTATRSAASRQGRLGVGWGAEGARLHCPDACSVRHVIRGSPISAFSNASLRHPVSRMWAPFYWCGD